MKYIYRSFGGQDRIKTDRIGGLGKSKKGYEPNKLRSYPVFDVYQINYQIALCSLILCLR